MHYRLTIQGQQTDNPDQRIAEDVRDFVESTTNFYVQIFVTSLSLYAFVQILWGISAEFPYKIGSLDLSMVPGYLVWIVLFLAIVVTFGTHLIGRPLVPSISAGSGWKPIFATISSASARIRSRSRCSTAKRSRAAA